MNLFYTNFTTDDGFNLNLFIQATTPERAVAIWRSYWNENYWEEEYPPFDNDLILSAPKTDDNDVLRLFQVTPSPGVEGALDWHVNGDDQSANSCKLIGYVSP